MVHSNKMGDCDQNSHMIEFGQMLMEDEYGYVDPVGHLTRISRDIMMQLPSNQLQVPACNVDTRSTLSSSEKRRRTLQRSETRYKTMKMKRVTFNTTSIQEDVEKVYELLMSDPKAEENEIKNDLRDLHHSLTVKRMVKAKIDSSQENRQYLKSLDCSSQMRYNMAMLWEKLKNSLKDLTYSLEPWRDPVKRIQGHCGSGVASYFIFLRWLLYLNIFNFITSFGFVVVPQLIYDKLDDTSPARESTVAFQAYELLTCSGWMGNSSFFYGHYTNKTIEVVPGYYYNMPLAYLFTVAIVAIVNLIVVATSVTKSYQANYLDSSEEINKICGKIFCAWDFNIEKSDIASLRHRLIFQELKRFLSHESKEKTPLNCLTTLLKFGISAIVNCFVIASISGIGYLVYFMLDKKAFEVDVKVLKLMTLSLTITTISLIFHYVISFVSKLEYFLSKQMQLYLLLARVAVLRVVILSILVYFWMVIYIPGPGDTSCYESLLGEEIYRLIIVNLLINLLLRSLFGEFLRKVLSKNLGCTKDYVTLAEFDVAYNTNDLIYYQTLVWVGGFYSPMLPLLLLLILVLLFYVKLNSVMRNCRPSQKPWSSSEAQTVFLSLTLINFLLAAAAVGYTIFRIKPSASCGPFRTHHKMYGIITELMNLSTEHNLLITQIMHYICSPALLFTVLLALSVSVYFARTHSLASENIVRQVRAHLIMESKDKVFLLHLFEEAYKEYLKSVNSPEQAAASNLDQGDDSKHVSEASVPPASLKEFTNDAYQDYHTNNVMKGHKSPILASQMLKYNPGYLLADVPVNRMSPEDGSKANRRGRSPAGSVSDSFYSDLNKSAFEDGSSVNDKKLPKHQEGKQQRKLLPRIKHKQGFQYTVRGESPPQSDDAF